MVGKSSKSYVALAESLEENTRPCHERLAGISQRPPRNAPGGWDRVVEHHGVRSDGPLVGQLLEFFPTAA